MNQRILLKISGEALIGNKHFVHDNNMINQVCDDIKEAHDLGYEVCLVVGGGNICRGTNLAQMGIDRSAGDYMGMLATVINAVAIQSKLESKNLYTRVSSAIPIITIVEQYIRRRAVRHLEKGRIVIFAAGTGNPFFTTDTSAALRAIEMNCSMLLKGSQVDGVYDKDPKKFNDAKKYDTLSYKDIIEKEISVMDKTAVTLASENNIPIRVFDITKKGNFVKVLKGEGKYTTIRNFHHG